MASTDLPQPPQHRLDLCRYLNERGLTKQGAEIGVLFGEFSRYILDQWPGTLYMVDPWENQSPEVYLDGCNSVIMKNAMARAQAVADCFPPRGQLVRKYSTDAATAFNDGSLDFVYIDANHSYHTVMQDLRAWMPKVKTRGVLAGHDFYNKHTEYQDCGVQRAVEDFSKEMRIPFYATPCTSWWMIVP